MMDQDPRFADLPWHARRGGANPALTGIPRNPQEDARRLLFDKLAGLRSAQQMAGRGR